MKTAEKLAQSKVEEHQVSPVKDQSATEEASHAEATKAREDAEACATSAETPLEKATIEISKSESKKNDLENRSNALEQDIVKYKAAVQDLERLLSDQDSAAAEIIEKLQRDLYEKTR